MNRISRLYVATTNAGKLRDFAIAAQLYSRNMEFIALPGIGCIPAPPEEATTFDENARTKAIEYSRHTAGCIVLADDSGLEVDALGGAPGVRSARYSADAGFDPGELSVDERNNLFLLENLRGVPIAKRTARYRCALAAALDGVGIAVGEGAVEGIILEAPRGSGGFGYDPLFFIPELEQAMSEITLERRLGISHRGHALRALLPQLSALIG